MPRKLCQWQFIHDILFIKLILKIIASTSYFCGQTIREGVLLSYYNFYYNLTELFDFLI